MDQEFHRIKRLAPYVFAEVDSLKVAARAAGEDIIDLGMGNPDQPPPHHVAEKLAAALMDPRIHRYSTLRGIPGLRRANALEFCSLELSKLPLRARGAAHAKTGRGRLVS